MNNDTECYSKRSLLACITTSMSTCSGDNAKRNLFNVRPATENVRPDGVDEPSTKFSGKSRHVEEKLISFVHNYELQDYKKRLSVGFHQAVFTST